MELETNIVAHAFGSARLRLANTDVLVAVKLEVDAPFPEKPREGKLEFFVDWYLLYVFTIIIVIICSVQQMLLLILKAEEEKTWLLKYQTV
jgi:hypothetical protein